MGKGFTRHKDLLQIFFRILPRHPPSIKEKMKNDEGQFKKQNAPFFKTRSKQWRTKDLGNMPSNYTSKFEASISV
jgi:hypothetical protein